MAQDSGKTLPHGPHEGKLIEDVPSDYLQTMVDSWLEDEWVIQAQAELAWRDHCGGHFD